MCILQVFVARFTFYSEYIYLVYAKTVDSVFRAL